MRERLASANALAISGKRCEPGFPDAEPFYTYTAPPRIFFRLTILNFLLPDRYHRAWTADRKLLTSIQTVSKVQLRLLHRLQVGAFGDMYVSPSRL
jgi:hypothetical protein